MGDSTLNFCLHFRPGFVENLGFLHPLCGDPAEGLQVSSALSIIPTCDLIHPLQLRSVPLKGKREM